MRRSDNKDYVAMRARLAREAALAFFNMAPSVLGAAVGFETKWRWANAQRLGQNE